MSVQRTTPQIRAQLQFKCEYCGAEPNELCRSPQGRAVYPHAIRFILWQDQVRKESAEAARTGRRMLTYRMPMHGGVTAALYLPVDLTQQEAERLQKMIGSLVPAEGE